MVQESPVPIINRSLELLKYVSLYCLLFILAELKIGFTLDHSLLIVVFFIVKIYFLSGFYGMLAELASGEELVIPWKNFKQNARQFWPLILVTHFLPALLITWLLWMAPSLASLAVIFSSQGNILLMALIAYVVIDRKYLRPSNIKRRRIPCDRRAISTILIFVSIDLCLLVATNSLGVNNKIFMAGVYAVSIMLAFCQYLYFTFLILDEYKEIAERFTKGSQLYLINPLCAGVFGGIITSLYRNHPPVFSALRALTPKHFTFREFNRVLWQDRYYQKDKLVALTCFTSNSYEAYKIAKEFRKRGSTVIMGGPHVTYLPDEALLYADSIVIGEAEPVWKEVVRDFENKSLKKVYKGVASSDFHKEVHQELLHESAWMAKEFIEPTRGCKFKCHFCTIPSFTGGGVRKKPISEVVELVSKVSKEYKGISFLDNNIYNDPAYASELFKAIKPFKIQWDSFCTIDIAKNDEALQLAKESGCHMLVIGFEITDRSAETAQKGKFTMAKKYVDYANKIRSHGIKIRGNFMFGFDSDGYKTLIHLWKCIFKIRPSITTLSFMTPIPGSVDFEQMVKDDRIINANWRNYTGYRLVFEHPRIKSALFSWLYYPFVVLFFQLTTSKVGLFVMAYSLLSVVTFILSTTASQ